MSSRAIIDDLLHMNTTSADDTRMRVSTSRTSPARYLLVISNYPQQVRSNRAALVRQVMKDRFCSSGQKPPGFCGNSRFANDEKEYSAQSFLSATPISLKTTSDTISDERNAKTVTSRCTPRKLFDLKSLAFEVIEPARGLWLNSIYKVFTNRGKMGKGRPGNMREGEPRQAPKSRESTRVAAQFG
jgi:hypothetical protein